jgi:hypothetical protein
MQGPIAQIIALTTFGNVFLADSSDTRLTNFYPSNSTFAFCKEVRFVDMKRQGEKREELQYADDPHSFFERLKDEGYKALRMRYAPSGEKRVSDRMLVGFIGGGGRWLIEVVGLNGSDYWEARWTVGNGDDPENRIWHVAYGRIASGISTEDLGPHDHDQLKSRLSDNLRSIAEFARRQRLDGFAARFDAALAKIDSDEPLKDVYHTDIAPAGALPEDACRLLAAAQAAWMFGGMGSWNDLGFDGAYQETYNKLSDQLYRLLIAAIVQAANMSVTGGRP